MRPVNQCSLYPIYFEVLMRNKVNGDEISLLAATGFIYSHASQRYLISNWHVFSGRVPTSPERHLPGVHGDPEYIRASFPMAAAIETRTTEEYRLSSDDGRRLWIEHPRSGLVDVAALRIDIPAGAAVREINEAMSSQGFGKKENFFHITREVWVVGFPKGVRIGGLPIWKRATIASEPRYSSQEVEHKVILDTATREGMSGSPVLYVGGIFTPVKFDGTDQEIDHASAKLLLGIYAGRIAGDDELSAQLGVVWNSDCLAEIFRFSDSESNGPIFL